MSIDSTWLRCPNCFQDLDALDPSDRTFGCASGHRFDRAKHGYLTLLPPRAPRTIGDDRGMLEDRAAWLATGAYTRIAEAVVDAVSEWRTDEAPSTGPTALAAGLPRDETPSPGVEPHRFALLDLGCGTGYYSSTVLSALPVSTVALTDRSPDAVRASLRAIRETRFPTDARIGVAGVVLDLWRPLPLRDGAADVALDVFAPRNPPEYARVIRPGGLLVVVVPTGRHLAELRAAGSLLEVPDDKDTTVSAQLAPHGFVPAAATRVEYTLHADVRQRAWITGMGPSAHHPPTTSLEERSNTAAGDAAGRDRHVERDVALDLDDDTGVVTVSVDVLSFSRT